MTLEAEQKANIFQTLLEDARGKKGKEIEIVTFANDTVSGFKRIYSHLGILGEGELNQALTEFIQKLVPEGESRATLEAGFEEDPDRVIHHSHHDEISSEWTTLLGDLMIGIKGIRDQRGISVKTWYLKSSETPIPELNSVQKENLFSRLSW
jgi:hypothetical protein